MNLFQTGDRSTSNADFDDGSESFRRALVVRENRLWTALPEDVFTSILKALSPSDYCRLRCVCKAWKRLLSSSPDWSYWKRTGTPCFIVTTYENFDVQMLCPSDEKFLSLPFKADLSSELDLALGELRGNFYMDWELVDVDEGLFCYHISNKDGSYLAVCDPLTQAYRITLPRTKEMRSVTFEIKLLADRESQTFKIVLTSYQFLHTSVFDSTTSRWTTLISFPYEANEFFVWRKVLYACVTVFPMQERLFSLDTGSGTWEQVEVAFPGGEGDRHILSDKKQIIFVRYYRSEHRFPFSVWKLKDDNSSHGPDFSLSMWENLNIERRLAVPDASTHRFEKVCCEKGYLCFVFRATREERISASGSMTNHIDTFVIYSLLTGKSRVIPFPSGRETEYLFPWEPNLDAEFKY